MIGQEYANEGVLTYKGQIGHIYFGPYFSTCPSLFVVLYLKLFENIGQMSKKHMATKDFKTLNLKFGQIMFNTSFSSDVLK